MFLAADPSLLDHLPEECVQCIGLAIRDPRAILRLGASCVALRDAMISSLLLWRTLCVELLGLPLVETHRTAWSADVCRQPGCAHTRVRCQSVWKG